MGLSRRETAKILGISYTRLRDLEHQGRLRPKGKKGERRRFDEEQVHRFARAKGLRPAVPITKPAEGAPIYYVDHEHAALIFDKLVEGVKKIDIVRTLRVHPAVVEQIAEHYDNMRKQQDPNVVIARCTRCRQNPARFCGECVAR